MRKTLMNILPLDSITFAIVRVVAYAGSETSGYIMATIKFIPSSVSFSKKLFSMNRKDLINNRKPPFTLPQRPSLYTLCLRNNDNRNIPLMQKSTVIKRRNKLIKDIPIMMQIKNS